MGKINANPVLERNERRDLRILVAPLDWGLGHATRCIPVINALIARGVTVYLAGTGPQEHLLRTEFPELPFLPLPGYDIRYSRKKAGVAWKIALQAPKIIRQIKAEQRWLLNAIEENSLDGIISDNRYGLFHPRVPCVFITHQLNIRTGLGGWLDKTLRRFNYGYIDRFNACWVPDEPGKPGLAGELSHPYSLPKTPVRYLGPISRLSQSATAVRPGHLLILFSGPEPQRTIFENLVVRQVSHYNGTATVVRGLPHEDRLMPSSNDLIFYNHLPAHLLNEEMLKADYVIARSGYTTIMDIAKLGKKAILVPTPGQAEQEYLAQHMSQQQRAVISDQEDFNLIRSLLLARGYPYKILPVGTDAALNDAVDEFLATVPPKDAR